MAIITQAQAVQVQRDTDTFTRLEWVEFIKRYVSAKQWDYWHKNTPRAYVALQECAIRGYQREAAFAEWLAVSL